MVSETPNLPVVHEALLPERHPQHDLFICDVADAVLKDVMPQMEHPFYSLSKNPKLPFVAMNITGNGWKSRQA